LFAFANTAVSDPNDVLGATTTKVARCNANLRTRPYTSAQRRVTIKTGARIAVVTSVTGGSWRVWCGGRYRAGRSWYRISAINGRSVRRLYGVSYLYAASGLFKTPAVTSTIVPAPTISPTPTPAGSTARPFPAPVTSRTVSVPTTIDATGATDVSAALNAFIGSVPNGSVIAFPPNATYTLTAGMKFTNRHDLVFEGNGTTLRLIGPDSNLSSGFLLWNGDSDIIVRHFTIVGQNTRPGVYTTAGNESRYGVLTYGAARVEISNVTILNPWSDYVLIGGTGSATGEIPSDNIWIHDSTMTGSGRMGISLISATHVLIERNTFDLTAWAAMDIEPDMDTQPVGWVTFRGNIIKRGGSHTPKFISADGHTTLGNVHDITITGNRTDGTLGSSIVNVSRRKNVVFTNNTALTAAAGPVLNFAHIDGLTVSGNIQPLTSGSLASISDCTNVVSH
jgi:hypothetical protein